MDKYQFTKRVLFLGVPDMGYIGLDTLLYAGVNIVGVIGPLKNHNTYHQFKNFVNARHQNFIEYDSLDSEETLEVVKNLKPDIAVVCSFNQKISKEFIDLIPNGILNIHPSLLPQYRGGNPYSWVIINGEEKTGVTIHFMSDKFDEGDIVMQQTTPINKSETMGTLFNRTNQIGCRMLLQALYHFDKEGTLKGIPQPAGEFIKAPNLKDNQTFIDFNKTSVEIERFVRALNPYLSTMCIYKNQIIKLHKVSVAHSPQENDFSVGEICEIKDDKVYIKTSDGCIVPEVMQFAGYFIGDCADFIEIIKPKVGDKFTNAYS